MSGKENPMQCPRCSVALEQRSLDGFTVSTCGKCKGNWLSEGELPQLEARVEPDPEWREGMIEWEERASKLHCPVCGEEMESFDYRGDGVQLDTCKEQHGYWLDAGEDRKVEAAMKQRVHEIERADKAEVKWGSFIYKMSSPSWLDRLDHFLKG
jgi:Zn-finger nucleic acid-binding protein